MLAPSAETLEGPQRPCAHRLCYNPSTKYPDPVAYYEKIFGRLRFNSAGWAQVHCCLPSHNGPDREESLSLHCNGGFNCFACGARGGDVLEHEHLPTGRDRRAIAQGWGAWSGKPIYEPPRPAWARPAPRPVIVKEPVEKPKLSPSFSRLRGSISPPSSLPHMNSYDHGFSVHALDGKIPRGNGWQNRPRLTRDLIEWQFQPRLFDGVMSWPNIGIRLDLEPAGDAPNIVTDVDIRTDDPVEICECMAAVRRHMGDRQPDAITGRDGLHFYDQLPRERLRAYSGPTPTGACSRTSINSIGLGGTRACSTITRCRGPSSCSAQNITSSALLASIR